MYLPREVNAHRRNYDYSLQVNRWILKSIGAWPELPTSSIAEKTLSRFLQLTCHSLIAFTVIPSILHMFFEEKDLRMKLKAIGPTSHWLMGGINYCSLLYQRKQIRTSIDHMENDWRMTKREDDREVMLKNAKLGRAIAGFCALIMQVGLFSYNITILTLPLIMVIDNKTVATGRLPCPSFNKIMDARFSPIYEIVFTLQCLSTFVVNSTTVGACGLAAVFTMHACSQLSVVMSRLEELVKENRYDIAQKKLASLVKRHLRALMFLSRMEAIMRQVCLVEFLGCTFNLCMLGYYILTALHEGIPTNVIITYVIILMAMMFNIFIFCYIGDLVTEQCKKVGEAAYMTNWYQLPRNTVLGLILIMLQSSKVIKITAGRIFHMSIATFGDVIKTSVAYLNMLRTLTM